MDKGEADKNRQEENQWRHQNQEHLKKYCHKNKFTKKYKDEKYPLIFFLIDRESVGNYCEVGSDKSQSVNDK